MIFEAYLNDHPMPIEIQENGSQVTLRMDGQCFEADLVQISPGRYSILFAGKVFDVFVDAPRNGEFHVALPDQRISLELVDPRKLKSLRHRHVDAAGEVAISSPMPGKVVKLLIQEGEAVKPGQGLIVIEAMKMQNELKSPREGKIKSVNATEGKTVNAGEELLVIA